MYVMDEYAFYPRPELIDRAVSMNSDVKIWVSTPNGVGNPFYQKRFSGKVPVFTYSWRDDPRKDQAWYDKMAREEDPVTMAQEVDMSYDASIEGGVVVIANPVLEKVAENI